VIPFALIAAGALALLLGIATLRSLGPGFRIGRLLATVRQVPLEEALRLAAAGERRYVAVHGRVDAEDPFLDAADRPLVYRRTRIEVRERGRWRRVEESVEQVPFELRDGLDALAVDTTGIGDGLVVMPRESAGLVRDLADRAPEGLDPDAPARARVDQVSSVEHATVLGWPAVDGAGRPTMTPGRGRPLVLSVLEGDEAMRVLAGGDRLRPRIAAALLALGVALGAIGIIWAGATSVGLVAAAEPATPAAVLATASLAAATSAPAPSGLAGDTRSSGEGPGLVGAPGLAIGLVVVIAARTVVATLAYVRLTGGSRRS